MNEVKIKTTNVLNGGIIETWKINGLFYVKAIVHGVVTFSEAVERWCCDQFVLEAEYGGGLDFSTHRRRNY